METDQAHEWGRAIVQAYMSWYVFFVAGNVAVMAWIHTRKMAEKSAQLLVCMLAFLNLGGIVSSGYILWYLHDMVAKPLPMLWMVISVAGGANTIALFGLLVLWSFVLIRRTYDKPIRTPKS
jgi:hypothetical protein